MSVSLWVVSQTAQLWSCLDRCANRGRFVTDQMLSETDQLLTEMPELAMLEAPLIVPETL